MTKQKDKEIDILQRRIKIFQEIMQKCELALGSYDIQWTAIPSEITKLRNKCDYFEEKYGFIPNEQDDDS